MNNKKMLGLIIIVLLISISTISFADDLNIDKWMVDAVLIDNGDLDIMENISYNFKDKFNGIYINILLKDTDGIEELQVYEIVDNAKIPYDLVDKAKKGDKGVFTSTPSQDSLEVKIFSPSKNEKKTFRIKYIIKNVAVNHVDTGELYYKFIASENKTFIDNFSAMIKLPDANREKTKIFAHGPLNGNINFIENNLIQLDVSNVSSGQFIEARLLFPKNFIKNSSKIGHSSFKNIIDEEISYIEGIEKDTEKRSKNKGLFNSLSLIISTVIVLILGFVINKLRRNVDIHDKLENLSPKDITPAELRFFYSNLVDGRSLMTTIFDLSRKGYIDIEEIASKNKNKNYFKLMKKEKENKDLLGHEVYILDWIFNSIGDGYSVTTKDINDYRKKSPIKFSKELNLWLKEVKENIKSRGYYEPRAKKYGGILLIVSTISFIIGIVSLAFNASYGLMLIVAFIFILIYAISLFYRKSDEGYIEYGMWKDFKKDLDKQKKGIYNEYDIKIPKDKTLLYALALGLSMKSINAINQQASSVYTTSQWPYWYFLTNKKGGSSFEDSLNSRFYGTTATSTSSSIGSGGGFSAGGGGGAGGSSSGGF